MWGSTVFSVVFAMQVQTSWASPSATQREITADVFEHPLSSAKAPLAPKAMASLKYVAIVRPATP